MRTAETILSIMRDRSRTRVTGELTEIERLTVSSERCGWKSAEWSLAGRLLYRTPGSEGGVEKRIERQRAPLLPDHLWIGRSRYSPTR